MEPKPMKAGRSPAYPTRRELLAGAASLALVKMTGLHLLFAEDGERTLSVAPIFEHGTGRGATGCVVVSPPAFLSEEEGMQVIREELARHGVQLKNGVVLQGVRIPQRMLTDEPEAAGKAGSGGTIVESKIHPKPLKLDGIDPGKRVAVEFVSRKGYFVSVAESLESICGGLALYKRDASLSSWFVQTT